MGTFALIAPWGFRLVRRIPKTDREEYLRRRRAHGHDAAEAWRLSIGCTRPKETARLALPEANFANVRRRFGVYAERFEDLTDLERLVVVGVLAERVEAEREKNQTRRGRHRV